MGPQFGPCTKLDGPYTSLGLAYGMEHGQRIIESKYGPPIWGSRYLGPERSYMSRACLVGFDVYAVTPRCSIIDIYIHIYIYACFMY